MDIATALGVMGLSLGASSIVLGFLGVQVGRRTTQVLASEAEKTRDLLNTFRESTGAFIASEGDKTRNLVTELHESTKTFVATLSAEHAEILKRLSAP